MGLVWIGIGLAGLVGIPLIFLRAYLKDRRTGRGFRAGLNSGNFLNDANNPAYWLAQMTPNPTEESARQNALLRKRLGKD